MPKREQLANKYRPLTFDDVIGQAPAVKVLRESVLRKEYFNVYLLQGEFGSGKTTLARIFSRALVCENVDDKGNPCNKCEDCLDHLNSSSMYYDEMDSSQVGNVVEIKKLKDMAHYGVPGSTKKRTVLFDEAHGFSKEAFDAVLKLFEEGSDKTIYFLTTTEPDKILPTVRSRCVVLDLKLVSPGAILTLLKSVCEREGIKHQESALQLLALESAGHVRDALMKLDQARDFDVTLAAIREILRIPNKEPFYQILSLMNNPEDEYLKYLSERFINSTGSDLYKYFLETLYDIILYYNGVKQLPAEEERLAEEAISVHGDNLMRIASVVKTFTFRNDFTLFILDMLSLKWLHGGKTPFFDKQRSVKFLTASGVPRSGDKLDRIKQLSKNRNRSVSVEETSPYEFAFIVGGRVKEIGRDGKVGGI